MQLLFVQFVILVEGVEKMDEILMVGKHLLIGADVTSAFARIHAEIDNNKVSYFSPFCDIISLHYTFDVTSRLLMTSQVAGYTCDCLLVL